MSHVIRESLDPLRSQPLAVLAACFAMMSPPSAAGSGEPLAAPAVVILDVAAAGLDVRATIAWGPGTVIPEAVRLVVRDAWCGLGYEASVQPSPDDSETPAVVPGVLAGAEKCGFQYHATVEGLDGVPLSDPLPFQVGLSCHSRCRDPQIAGADPYLLAPQTLVDQTGFLVEVEHSNATEIVERET